MAKVAKGVVDTGGKFAAGVFDTGGKYVSLKRDKMYFTIPYSVQWHRFGTIMHIIEVNK